MKNLRSYILLAAIVIIVSCAKDSLFKQVDIKDFSIENAKSFFEENALELKLIPFTVNNHNHSDEHCNCTSHIILPTWEKALINKSDNIIQYEVPLKINYSIGATLISYNKETDAVHSIAAKHQAYLVITKNVSDNSISMNVVTLIGRFMNDKIIMTEESLTIRGGKKDFYGFIIESDLSGNILKSESLFNGEVSNLNSVIKYTKEVDMDSYFGYLTFMNNPLTKGDDDGYQSGCPNYVNCSICGIFTLNTSGICWACEAFPPAHSCHIPGCTGTWCLNPGCHYCGSPSCQGQCNTTQPPCPNCGKTSICNCYPPPGSACPACGSTTGCYCN